MITIIKKLAYKKKLSSIEIISESLSIITARLKIIKNLNKQIGIIGIIWFIDVLTVYSNDVYLRICKLLDEKKEVNSIKNIVQQITDANRKKQFEKKIIGIKKLNKEIKDKRDKIIAHSNRKKDNAKLWHTKLAGKEIEKVEKIVQELKKLVQEINLEFGNERIDFNQHDFLVEQCKASLELVKKLMLFHREQKKSKPKKLC